MNITERQVEAMTRADCIQVRFEDLDNVITVRLITNNGTIDVDLVGGEAVMKRGGTDPGRVLDVHGVLHAFKLLDKDSKAALKHHERIAWIRRRTCFAVEYDTAGLGSGARVTVRRQFCPPQAIVHVEDGEVRATQSGVLRVCDRALLHAMNILNTGDDDALEAL